MEKKATSKPIRTDGYQPKSTNTYGYQPRRPIAGYKPNKPDTKPSPPTTDTNVTTDKK